MKIVFDEPPDVLLGPGMSVVTDGQDQITEQRRASRSQSRSAAGDRSPWLIAVVVYLSGR